MNIGVEFKLVVAHHEGDFIAAKIKQARLCRSHFKRDAFF